MLAELALRITCRWRMAFIDTGLVGRMTTNTPTWIYTAPGHCYWRYVKKANYYFLALFFVLPRSGPSGARGPGSLNRLNPRLLRHCERGKRRGRHAVWLTGGTWWLEAVIITRRWKAKLSSRAYPHGGTDGKTDHTHSTETRQHVLVLIDKVI